MNDSFYDSPRRDTQLEPRFFFLNWRVLWFLVPLVLVPENAVRLGLFILIICLMIFLRLAENRGLSFWRALRAMRASFAGARRYGRNPRLNRKTFHHHRTTTPVSKTKARAGLTGAKGQTGQ